MPCVFSLQLESSITYEKLEEWTDMENVNPQRIVVYLPRFRMEDSDELTPVLQAVGMRDAFTLEQADFSSLSRELELFLSNAIYKSIVEVNEEGTEADVDIMYVLDSPCRCIDFRANHPFLFLIKHNPSKNILFFG